MARKDAYRIYVTSFARDRAFPNFCPIFLVARVFGMVFGGLS